MPLSSLCGIGGQKNIASMPKRVKLIFLVLGIILLGFLREYMFHQYQLDISSP
jgi:hypothetical protein